MRHAQAACGVADPAVAGILPVSAEGILPSVWRSVAAKMAATRAGQTPATRTTQAAPRAGGFTLLEILLAVAIVVGLMGTLFPFYTAALDARRAAEEAADFAAARRRIFDAMTAELHSATADTPLAGGFRGGTDFVEFPTALLPGASAWVQTNITEQPPAPTQDVPLVGYALRYAVDDSGELLLDADGTPVVVGLERREQRVVLAETAEEGVEIVPRLLTRGIKFLRVRYLAVPRPDLDEQPWQDQWEQEGMPAAVEISLGPRALPAGVEPAEYPYETWRRVVTLPAGGEQQREPQRTQRTQRRQGSPVVRVVRRAPSSPAGPPRPSPIPPSVFSVSSVVSAVPQRRTPGRG